MESNWMHPLNICWEGGVNPGIKMDGFRSSKCHSWCPIDLAHNRIIPTQFQTCLVSTTVSTQIIIDPVWLQFPVLGD